MSGWGDGFSEWSRDDVLNCRFSMVVRMKKGVTGRKKGVTGLKKRASGLKKGVSGLKVGVSGLKER